MNNPQNPLIPQGSLLEQKNKGRARVKILVFAILAVHGVGLMALLMAGCRREEPQAALPDQAEVTNSVPLPVFDEPTNMPAPVADTVSNDVIVPPPYTAPPVQEPIPVQMPTPSLPTAPANEYVVAKGDTFSGIAGKFHVTVKALVDANPGVQPTKLQIGQKIHIPAPTAPATSTAAPAASLLAADGTQVYTVKSGDTLSRIAGRLGTTVKAIRSANGLKTDRITVGQKLKVPVKAAAPAPAPAPAPVVPEPVPVYPTPGQ